MERRRVEGRVREACITWRWSLESYKWYYIKVKYAPSEAPSIIPTVSNWRSMCSTWSIYVVLVSLVNPQVLMITAA